MHARLYMHVYTTQNDLCVCKEKKRARRPGDPRRGAVFLVKRKRERKDGAFSYWTRLSSSLRLWSSRGGDRSAALSQGGRSTKPWAVKVRMRWTMSNRGTRRKFVPVYFCFCQSRRSSGETNKDKGEERNANG